MGLYPPSRIDGSNWINTRRAGYFIPDASLIVSPATMKAPRPR
jgi:hypothetical protein